MNKLIKITIPILILALSAVSWAVMEKFSPKPVVMAKKAEPPAIRAVAAGKQTVTLFVETHGVVEPRTETVLAARVSGKIIRVSQSFHAGGYFKKGDVLLEIEPGDYDAAIGGAEAELARARLKLARQEALAAQAEKDWRELGKGKAPPLVARSPQLAEARAGVKFAEAELKRAKRQRSRTRIRAPYPSIVREKRVGIGQYVGPGTELGTVFAVDFAEVRLPVKSADLARLDLPEINRDEKNGPRPGVRLSATIGGAERRWEGRITRTEGMFDPSSHVLYVVARIPDPYGFANPDAGEPLMMGTFVKARIEGITVKDAVVMPSYAVRDSDTALIVDSENRLHRRKIKILHADSDRVVIADGVSAGDTVCLTTLDYVAEGMAVRPIFRETSEHAQGPKNDGGVS